MRRWQWLSILIALGLLGGLILWGILPASTAPDFSPLYGDALQMSLKELGLK